jgi:hypothetical protein
MTGCILVFWKCLGVLRDSQLSVSGPIPLVQTVETGRRCHTAGMVIVEERYPPSMRFLYNGRSHCTPRIGILITNIVLVSIIQWVVPLHPVMPHSDCILWFLCNTIDWNGVNMSYMYVILFDA